FGAHQSAPDDARRALAAALALINAIEQWSNERRDGAPLIAIGIGLHYGMAAFGPAGGEQAIIGDTVNVASRLERLTPRAVSPAVAVSDETLRAISGREGDPMRAQLKSVGTVRLPGCGPRRVWIALQ